MKGGGDIELVCLDPTECHENGAHEKTNRVQQHTRQRAVDH